MKNKENVNWYSKTFFTFLCVGIGIGPMRRACWTLMRTWVQVCTPVKAVCGVCISCPGVWGRAEKGRFPIAHWLASITKIVTFSFCERPCMKEQAVWCYGRRHFNPPPVLHGSIREEECSPTYLWTHMHVLHIPRSYINQSAFLTAFSQVQEFYLIICQPSFCWGSQWQAFIWFYLCSNKEKPGYRQGNAFFEIFLEVRRVRKGRGKCAHPITSVWILKWYVLR